MTEKKTGYASIDKPWLKFYKSPGEYTVPRCKNFDYVYGFAKEYGEMVAIEYYNKKISYNQLFEFVESAARALKKAGAKEGDYISVCLPNIPEVVYIYYAINRIGAIANMLDVRSSSSMLIHACKDAKSTILISIDIALDKFLSDIQQTSIEQIVSVSPFNSIGGIINTVFSVKSNLKNRSNNKMVIPWNIFINNGKAYTGQIDSEYVPDSIAAIAYTGGTTGIPKGVIVTNECLNSHLEMTRYDGYPFYTGDSSLLIAPPWTFYGLNNGINHFLQKGRRMIMLPKVGADDLGKIIMKYKPNHIITVPSALNAVMKDIRKGYDLSFIKSLFVGADKLDETFEVNFNHFLKEHNSETLLSKGYGMTEVAAAATYTNLECNVIGSVGIPCVGNTISVFEIDSDLCNELRIGEKGEVAITGPSLMEGYFGFAAEESKTVLKKHPDGTVWAHTGDIGHMNQDGVLFIDGRIKRMFTKNGYKVFSAEVERQIMRCNAVEICAVIAVPDEIFGSKEKAYVVLKHGYDPDSVRSELISLLKSSLFEYEIPDEFRFLDKLPLTGMNKIDYRALEKQ